MDCNNPLVLKSCTGRSNKGAGGKMNGYALSGGVDQDARFQTKGRVTPDRGEKFFRAFELMN